MKYNFLPVILFLSFFLSNNLRAQTTGTGCNLGSSVATELLGTAIYNGQTDRRVYVYNSSPSKIIGIISGQGYTGYRCGYINIYPAGTRWVPSRNTEVSYKAANEITSYNTNIEAYRCVIASSLPLNFVSAADRKEGFQGGYRYNDPSYYADSDPSYACSSPTANLPLDHDIVILTFLSGIIGFLFIRKRGEFLQSSYQ